MQPLNENSTDALHGGPSFSFGNRVFRSIWIVSWMLLAAWTPPPLHPWRRLILRLFGAKVGKGVRIWGATRVWYPPNIELGDYAVLGPNVNCYSQGKIVLEPYANVAQNSHLVTGTHDIDSSSFQLFTRPIRICRYAWVAADAFVGPGVTIGEGAVLGGRGVTFKSLEPWTVYGGNPAREIRKRRNWASTLQK